MKFVKPRKPRGIKKNGQRSYNLCTGCYARNCDPMARSPKFDAMVHRRLEAGVCVACGYNPCRCKSSLFVKVPVMKTHNNKQSKKVR